MPASVLLAIAMTFHLEAGFLLPSLLFLYWRALGDRRWWSVTTATLLSAAVIVGTLWYFHTHGLPLTDIYTSHAFARGEGYAAVLVIPSRAYYADLLNLVYLLAPAWMLVLPLAAYRRVRLDAVNVHLLAASVVMGLFVVVWRAGLGVYNDWNLFAMAALPVALLVWRNVLTIESLTRRPAPVVAIYLLALVHSGSWIVANHRL